jgi:hypothetical protein
MYLASPAAPTFKIKQSSSRTRVGQDARQQASLAAGFQALRTGGAPLARLLVALASPPRVSLAPHTCRCVTDAWWGVRHPAGTWHLDVATRPSFAGCRSSISSKASSAVYRRERRSMGSFSTMAPAEVTPRPWSRYLWVIVRLRCHVCSRNAEVRLAALAARYGRRTGPMVLHAFMPGCLGIRTACCARPEIRLPKRGVYARPECDPAA